MNKFLKRACPLVTAVAVIFSLAICANGAVLSVIEDPIILDPAKMDATVFPRDDGYYMSLIPDPKLTYWERYLDGELRYTYTGDSWNCNSQERLLDNIDFHVYPFGKNGVLSNEGLTSDAKGTIKSVFVFDQTNTISQPFNITLTTHIVYYDAQGQLHEDVAGSPWTTTYDPLTYGSATRTFSFDFYIDREVDGFFFVYYTVEFAGIENESVNTNVNFDVRSSVTLTLPVNGVYGEYVQNGQTNQYLDRLESHLASQNQTLQDVLTEQETTNEKLDGIQDSMDTTNDHLDQMVNGQVSPNDPAGSDKIDDVTQQEDEIVEEYVDGAWGDFLDAIEKADDTIQAYGVALLACTAFLNGFMTLPFYSSLLYICFALGICAVLFNIAVVVVRHGGKGDVKQYRRGE